MLLNSAPLLSKSWLLLHNKKGIKDRKQVSVIFDWTTCVVCEALVIVLQFVATACKQIHLRIKEGESRSEGGIRE